MLLNLSWLNNLSSNLLFLLVLLPVLPATFAPSVTRLSSEFLVGLLSSFEALDEPEVGYHEETKDDLDGFAASLMSMVLLAMETMFSVESSVVWSLFLLICTLVEFLSDLGPDWGTGNDDHVVLILISLNSWSSVVSLSSVVFLSSVVTSSLVMFFSSEPSSEDHVSILLFTLWWWWSSSVMMTSSSEFLHHTLEESWLLFILIFLFVLLEEGEFVNVRALEHGRWKCLGVSN